MKNVFNTNQIEQALLMYKETVSPSDKGLQDLLSQIPEQKKKEAGRAIRSPYIWVTITQAVTVCCLLLVLYPSLIQNSPSYEKDPFYSVDQQVESFEQELTNEDITHGVNDLTLLQ
jgi:hypothetical protein